MDATKCDMELMDAYGPTRERCVLTLKGLETWGLFGDYRVAWYQRESARQPSGPITPMEDASAASRMREIRPSGSRWRGPETE